MRILARRLSKWCWLAVAVTAAGFLVLAPALVIFGGARFFLSSIKVLVATIGARLAGVVGILVLVCVHLVGAIVGPPAIWSRPLFHSPRRAELAGQYVETERHWNGPASGKAVVELRENGTMVVRDLPNDETTTSCTLSGEGTWTGPDEDMRIHLIVKDDGLQDACRSGDFGSMEISGHSRPYELYWVLGDPDSGEGVWLKRQ